jgi:hypothetical protein
MACSFVMTGEFSPSRSVIHTSERIEGNGYAVKFISPPGGSALPCPDCLKNGAPLCVQYCEKSTDLIRLIEQGAFDEK